MANANQKARARIRATRQDLAQARTGGFKTTGSALDAIYANLATTQGGIGKTQTVASQRALAAVARIAGRTNRASARQATKGQGAFGAVAGAAADRQNRSVEANVKAGRTALGADLGATKTQAKGAADVLGILQAGATAAQAGAKGQLADALAYRARQDASVVADMQKARLDAQLQFQTWKRQQDYLKRQETKDKTGSLGGVSAVADTAGDAAVWFREYMQQNPGATAQAALNAYQAANYVDANAAPMLGLIANKVYQSVDPATGLTRDGYTRVDETRDIMQAVATLYPNFGKVHDKVASVISSRWDAWDAGNTAKAAEDAARTAANPPPDGTPVLDPQKAQRIVTRRGGDASQTRQVTVAYGPDAGQTHTIDENGYVVTDQPKVTDGVAATDTSFGTTQSGRQYRLVGGNPYYIDTGYIVPADDLPA